jgi:hypothetical protein
MRKFWVSIVSIVERYLSGGRAPSDPLYLTNRTIGQRLRLAAVVAVPGLILVGVVALGAGRYFRVRDKEQRQLTSAELAQQLLPGLAKNIDVRSNHDLEVAEARVEPGRTVSGTVKNNTDHAIDHAAVILDLTTVSGARLGAVAAKIPHVGPKSTAAFRIKVEQDTAVFAQVREVVLQPDGF